MWGAIGGQKKAQEINREIAQYVDVMIGNEEDFTACLGFEIEGNSQDLQELNLEGYQKMVSRAAEAYPNFKVVATTLREVKTATIYGLMDTGDPQIAVNYGAAHGALAMTTPGDTTMASQKEVEAVMGGAGARVQR